MFFRYNYRMEKKMISEQAGSVFKPKEQNIPEKKADNATVYCAIVNFAHVAMPMNLSERAKVFVNNPHLETVSYGSVTAFKNSGLSNLDFAAHIASSLEIMRIRNDVWGLKFPQEGIAVFQAHPRAFEQIRKDNPHGRFYMTAYDNSSDLMKELNSITAAHRSHREIETPYLDA